MARRFPSICVGLLAILCGSHALTAAEPGLKIGMVQSMFRDVQPSLVQALSRPFRTLIEKQTGLTGDVEIHEDAFALAKNIHDEKLHIGVFHGYEYAWVHKQNPEFIPLALAMPQGRTLQAYVVVHKDCIARSLRDLEGECLTIPRGTKGHCITYIDKARASLPATCMRTSTKKGLTSEESLNAVANGESDAALVDAAAYAGYLNLQPGGAKQLRVMCKSELFPATVVVYRKGSIDERTIDQLRTGLTTAHKTAQYRPLMMIWNLKGFEEVPADYSEDLATILDCYPIPKTIATIGTTKVEK